MYLHHAYVGESREQVLELLGKDIENIVEETYEMMTMEQARNLRMMSIEKGIEGKKKIFIINALGINTEATHAFLKVLEEPTPDTHFFFVLPRVNTLPKTLLSRVFVLKNDEDSKISKSAKDFVEANPSERLKIVKKLIASHDKDDGGAQLKEESLKLIENSLELIHSKVKTADDMKTQAMIMEELSRLKTYLQMRGSSAKIILEQAALTI